MQSYFGRSFLCFLEKGNQIYIWFYVLGRIAWKIHFLQVFFIQQTESLSSEGIQSWTVLQLFTTAMLWPGWLLCQLSWCWSHVGITLLVKQPLQRHVQSTVISIFGVQNNIVHCVTFSGEWRNICIQPFYNGREVPSHRFSNAWEHFAVRKDKHCFWWQ